MTAHPGPPAPVRTSGLDPLLGLEGRDGNHIAGAAILGCHICIQLVMRPCPAIAAVIARAAIPVV